MENTDSNVVDEIGLIRAAIHSPATIDKISAFLTPADFSNPILGKTFQLLASIRKAGMSVISVHELFLSLRVSGLLDALGGPSGFARLIVDHTPAADAMVVAERIHNASLRRTFAALACGLVRRAAATGRDPEMVFGASIASLTWAETQELAVLSPAAIGKAC